MSIFLKEEFNRFLSANYQEAVLSTVEVAERRKINIFLIGGIVRDLILNQKIKDIDITVEFDAIEFAKILEMEIGCEILSVQETLRTAKVKFSNGVEVDFASTREEKYVKSGVLPIAENFGCSLEIDVKRRDFTINTLALNLVGENKFCLVDFYNGYNDIKQKQIRVLHDKSFYDDPSRIVRALKFKVRFGFDFEEKTYVLMQNYLQNVDETMPLERIKNEFKQYFSINKSLLYKQVIDTNIFKLISDNPISNFDERKINELKTFDIDVIGFEWFIYIALLIVNSDFAIERLNLTSVEKKILFEVKEMQLYSELFEKIEIYKAYNDKTEIALAIYYLIDGKKSLIQYLTALKQVVVLTKGNDLIELGFEPSPYFNELFGKILKEKLDGKLKTKEEEKEFIKQFMKKEE